MPNTCFSWLKWVTTKSPVQAAKTLKDKSLKNFSKCFSRLEGLLARESRAEPRKSLSNPRDWTFHSWTSCQKWPASTRLRLATWLTRDWVTKTGQNWIFEIFKFWNQNTFQKHLKHSKIFVLELTKIEHVKTHFIKYNHTNDYGIYQTQTCVLCVDINNEIVLSLIWRFNDQFNQGIHN